MKKIIFTSEQVSEICKLYLELQSLREIAVLFDVSYAKIKNTLIEAGIQIRDGRRVKCGKLRKCYVCKDAKNIKLFTDRKSSPGGKSYICQDCKKLERIKNKYGLSPIDYASMLVAQNNKCRICYIEFDNEQRGARPCVDHCHSQGNVRGILCNNCNSGLGFFYDNIANLQNAIKYLT